MFVNVVYIFSEISVLMWVIFITIAVSCYLCIGYTIWFDLSFGFRFTSKRYIYFLIFLINIISKSESTFFIYIQVLQSSWHIYLFFIRYVYKLFNVGFVVMLRKEININGLEIRRYPNLLVLLKTASTNEMPINLV